MVAISLWSVDKNFDASASRSFFHLAFGIALHVLI